MKNALVSVIIPTYSRPKNLIRAIESVLAQTYGNTEIIVVDDNGAGTTYQQETAQLLQAYIQSQRITYLIHKTNKNGSAARNTGFRASVGKYVNFLDDDDVLGADKLQKQVAYLEQHPDIDATFCDTEIIITEKKRQLITNPYEANWIESLLLEEAFFNTSTVLFRRTAIEALRGFDERFLRHQDWELYLRFFQHHKIAKCDCMLLKKYASPNIITRQPKSAVIFLEQFLDTFRVLLMQQPRGKAIFRYRYEKVVEILLAQCCYREALYCLKKSLTFGYPSFSQIIRYGYFLIRPCIPWKH